MVLAVLIRGYWLGSFWSPFRLRCAVQAGSRPEASTEPHLNAFIYTPHGQLNAIQEDARGQTGSHANSCSALSLLLFLGYVFPTSTSPNALAETRDSLTRDSQSEGAGDEPGSLSPSPLAPHYGLSYLPIRRPQQRRMRQARLVFTTYFKPRWDFRAVP